MNGPRPPIPNLDKILKASEDKELWDYFFNHVLDRSPASKKLEGPKVTRDWYDDDRWTIEGPILPKHHCCCCCKCSK